MIKLPHPIPYQGSKRKLAPTIANYVPKNIRTFYEPFCGSAAMTVYAAHFRHAERFVVADSLEPMVGLRRSIVGDPARTPERYKKVWHGQRDGGTGYFNEVRARYNDGRDPVDLLYLICRCVKNAARFNKDGRFTQSVDKRRLGMHPDKMNAAVLGMSRILRGKTEFRIGDWKETTTDAVPGDFVYMDPPYLGTSIGLDKRYHQQLTQEALCVCLEDLGRRGIPFALSYDGMTGGREYGPPLPDELGLTRLLLHAGTSSQSTLSGRKEETIESLYVTPGLAEPESQIIRTAVRQISLAV